MKLKPLLLDIEQNEANKEINEIENTGSLIQPIETDSDYGDLLASDEKGIILSEQINNEIDADVALETISNYLKQSSVNSIYDKHTLNMTNVAIEAIYNRVNIRAENLTFSMENYSSDPKETIRLALEDIKEKAAALWLAVKEKITLLAKFLGEKMNYFKRNLSNMRANVVRLEKILGTIDRSEQAKSKYLKPQNWFIDLMYSDKGMPIGLTGIGKAIEDLIHSHRKMATTSVNKYTKWLLANYKQAQSDSKAFGTLKISPSEFILQGSSEFNRSIGLKRPLGDNVFYRGKELPGNKAFYTQVRPKDKIGISSIGTIADVGFGIYDYDPQSYRLNRLNLYNISKISTISWVASMVLTFPLIGVTVGASVASLGPALYAIYKSSAIAETGNNVRIDKSMVFETLTIDQIKNVLNEVNKGIKELHNWHNDVFENNWKKPELDSIINNITGLDRIEVNNNSSFRALKRYCMALLNLMNSTTIGVHAYAFKTYGAMINYADKSLKQYKPKE